jgi:hypothetical protein
MILIDPSDHRHSPQRRQLVFGNTKRADRTHLPHFNACRGGDAVPGYALAVRLPLFQSWADAERSFSAFAREEHPSWSSQVCWALNDRVAGAIGVPVRLSILLKIHEILTQSLNNAEVCECTVDRIVNRIIHEPTRAPNLG